MQALHHNTVSDLACVVVVSISLAQAAKGRKSFEGIG